MRRDYSVICRLRNHAVVAAICVALCGAAYSQTADTTSAKLLPEKKSPTGALLRSMVVPGWGQVYNGKYLKSIIYAGAQLTFLYGAHVQNDRYHHYRDLGNQDFANFYENDRNRLLWWLFGITLLSMGDAFVDASLAQFDVSDNMSARLTPNIDPRRAGIGLSLALFFDYHAKNP
jgi:hypothetical protein